MQADRWIKLPSPYRLDLTNGQTTIIGKHTSAISRICYEPSTNLLLTSSWDKTLRIWDPTAQQPRLLKTLVQPDKILAMDITPPYPSSALVKQPIKKRVVLATTSRHVRIYDLEVLRQRIDESKEDDGDQWDPEQQRESSLKYMIRDVRCTPEGTGEAHVSLAHLVQRSSVY